MIRVITSWQIRWVLNLFQTTALRNVIIVSFEQLLTVNTVPGALGIAHFSVFWNKGTFACGEFLILISNPEVLSSESGVAAL